MSECSNELVEKCWLTSKEVSTAIKKDPFNVFREIMKATLNKAIPIIQQETKVLDEEQAGRNLYNLWRRHYSYLRDQWEEMADDVKETWIQDARQICNSAVTRKQVEQETRQEIAKWGIEQCQEHYKGGGVISRRECPKCWQSLQGK